MPVLDLDIGGGGPTALTCSPWATSADAVGPCASYDFDPALLDQAMQMATDILFLLTNSRWPGECADVIRPPSQCACGFTDQCSCGWVSQIRLPGFPVVAVDQVLVDGAVVPPARYRVDNYAHLVFTPDPADGSQPIAGWPLWQRADLPTTEQGTWQVSYSYGTPPPQGGKTAAALLGCQIALGLIGSDECQLPAGTIQATRQNLTIAILDPATVFPEGRTGIATVDLWLSSVKIGDERKPSTAWVPGRRTGSRRRTS